MNNIKTKMGISLVALIITIIVLLLLAVVTTGVITEKTGIIKRAEDAKFISDYQLVKTDIDLYKMNNQIENKEINNEDLIGTVAKKVIVKDTARELAVIVDLEVINSKTNYGKGGIKLLEEDNDKNTIKEIETLYDLKDVYAIDLNDGVLYYIDGENIYTLETEKIEIEENGIITNKYPIETIDELKYVNEELFITKWNVKDEETNDTTVVLPIHQASTYDAIIYWGDGTSTKVEWKGTNIKLTEEKFNILTSMVTHTYELKENDNGVYTIAIEGTYPDYRMNTSTSTPTMLKLVQIEQWGSMGVRNVDFSNCTNLGGIVPKQNKENTFEKCTTISFQNTGIKGLKEGFLLPKNITSVAGMFMNCKDLESIPNSFQIPTKETSTYGLFSRLF